LSLISFHSCGWFICFTFWSGRSNRGFFSGNQLEVSADGVVLKDAKVLVLAYDGN
jgi:hypothetical protein